MANQTIDAVLAHLGIPDQNPFDEKVQQGTNRQHRKPQQYGKLTGRIDQNGCHRHDDDDIPKIASIYAGLTSAKFFVHCDILCFVMSIGLGCVL